MEMQHELKWLTLRYNRPDLTSKEFLSFFVVNAKEIAGSKQIKTIQNDFVGS